MSICQNVACTSYGIQRGNQGEGTTCMSCGGVANVIPIVPRGNEETSCIITGSIEDVVAGYAQLALVNTDVTELFSQLPDDSVSAIITDPPYDKGSLSLYGACYRGATAKLRPHGDLMMIMPHYALDPFRPPMSAGLATDHDPLRYRWTLSMNQRTGAYPRLVNGHRNLAVTWKPIGWWYKFGSRPDNYAQVVDSEELFYYDSYDNPQPEKIHKWQQSDEWADFCLERLYFSGQRQENGEHMVVDPMVGSGTLAIQALLRGYRVVAGDWDPDALQLARDRIQAHGYLGAGGPLEVDFR